MARNLPNLNLKAFFLLGEDGWNDDIDLNFLTLSIATQGVVEALVATRPSSPISGGVYLLAETDPNNPNAVAVYENSTWKYLQPKAGWLFYDKTASQYRFFNGTVWALAPLVDPRIRALAGLDATPGLINQTGAATFEKRAIGVSTSNDIISRGLGDVRYAAAGHTHPNSVQSFNTRVGSVTLLAADLQAALGYVPQAKTPASDSLSNLDATLGLVEQITATTFAKRIIGGTNATDIPSIFHADSRYAPRTAISAALSAMSATPGIVEQTGAATFTKRKIDDINDVTSLATIGGTQANFIAKSLLTFDKIQDGPGTYEGGAGQSVRVKLTEDGVEFVPANTMKVTLNSTLTYSVLKGDAGKHLGFTNNEDITVTLPTNAFQPMVVGSTIRFQQIGKGSISFGGDPDILTPPSFREQTCGQGAVVTLVKYDTDKWAISGDLSPNVAIQSGSYTLSPFDSYIRTIGTSSTVVLVPFDLAVSNGTTFTLYQGGNGSLTISPDTNVTLNGPVVSPARFAALRLTKIGDNEWDVIIESGTASAGGAGGGGSNLVVGDGSGGTVSADKAYPSAYPGYYPNASYPQAKETNCPSGDSVLYTLPTGRKALLLDIYVTNPTGSAITYYPKATIGGTARQIGVPAIEAANGFGHNYGSTGERMIPIVLNAGENIIINADQAGATFWLNFIEFDASSHLARADIQNWSSGNNTLLTLSSGMTLSAGSMGLAAGNNTMRMTGVFYINSSNTTRSLSGVHAVPDGDTPSPSNQLVGFTSVATNASLSKALPGNCLSENDSIILVVDSNAVGQFAWMNYALA